MSTISPTNLDYPKILLKEEQTPEKSSSIRSQEFKDASDRFLQCLEQRSRYIRKFDPSLEPDFDPTQFYDVKNLPKNQEQRFSIQMTKGVITAFDNELKTDVATEKLQTLTEFTIDFSHIIDLFDYGPAKSFAYQRLKVLEHLFSLHKLLNQERESLATRHDPTDWERVVKVDTHIHLAAGMTGDHLLEFIMDKYKTSPNDKVFQNLTLSQLFEKLQLKVETLTINALDCQADSAFERFDVFNGKYNPFGDPSLRTVFLKTANDMKGQYFAELTQQLFGKTEKSSIYTEYRLSIYGKDAKEWSELSKWIFDWKLHSDHNRWMIQLPRLYGFLRKTQSTIVSFETMIHNIFWPLFEVSINPSKDPVLFRFLQQISGFDSVDDESKVENIKLTIHGNPDAAQWTTEENPSYAYYMYYTWVNITSLNYLRRRLNLNTFSFRPHSGESGDVDHLAAAFLLANSINHGIRLKERPVLEYLYYLAQIGLAVSPLSNNSLFLDYKRSPFPEFFARGLNVSLSTDDPLQFHWTGTPLVEEYAVASSRWGFSEVDISEIARNSVLQSGFSHKQKQQWVCDDYTSDGIVGNDFIKTNIPNIRINFRHETYKSEISNLKRLTSGESSLHFVTAVGLKDCAEETMIEPIEASHLLNATLRRREKYMNQSPKLDLTNVGPPMTAMPNATDSVMFQAQHGVYQVFTNKQKSFCMNDQQEIAAVHCQECDSYFCFECDQVLHKHPSKKHHTKHPVDPVTPFFPISSWSEFVADYRYINEQVIEGVTLSFAISRIKILQASFNLHKLLNEHVEKESQRVARIDVNKLVKVDNCCHVASMPIASELLTFMKHKLQTSPNEVVMQENGKDITLADTFKKIGLSDTQLTVDSLEVKAYNRTYYRRFDKFDATYNPFGSGDLRKIFLKRENSMGGKYFAEIMLKVFRIREQDGSTMHEFRVSIYGSDAKEWSNCAKWFKKHKVHSPQNRWVIQLPKIYDELRKHGHITSFQDYLDNVFRPLFEVSKNPMSDPELHQFLQSVSAFDSVGKEEGIDSIAIRSDLPEPHDWTDSQSPPYSYEIYYLWANITVLNRFRESRGLHVFEFRSHCGVGAISHFISTFLLCKSISNGLNLTQQPTLQYLYYLAKIPIFMSPLEASAFHLEYANNPFRSYFDAGLVVSLCTENPLQLHFTEQPLREEYAVASSAWKLSFVDLAEIFRNSVLSSGFENHKKRAWLGDHFWDATKNDVTKTGVPMTRLLFRQSWWERETAMIQEKSKQHTHDAQNPEHQMMFIPKFEQSLKDLRNISVNKILKKQRRSFSTLLSSIVVGLSAGLTVVAIVLTKRKFFD